MLSARSSTADKPQVVEAALVVCSQDSDNSSLFVWEKKKKILQHRTKFESF